MKYVEILKTKNKGIRLSNWVSNLYITSQGLDSLSGYKYIPTREDLDSESWELYKGDLVSLPDESDVYALPPILDVAN